MEHKDYEALIKATRESGESETVEVKKNNEDEELIVRSISALSNSARLLGMDSGYVIWGLENETFNIVGTKFRPGNKKVNDQEISNWIGQHIKPKIYFVFNETEIEGKHLVVLEVGAAQQSPTEAVLPNKPPRAFIRTGSSTKPLDDHPEHKRKLWEALVSAKPEEDVVIRDQSASKILSMLDIERYRVLAMKGVNIEENELLDHFVKHHLILKTSPSLYSLPLFSAYALAKDLKEIPKLENKYIRLIVYEGSTRLDSASVDEEFATGVISSVEAVYRRVMGLIPTTECFDSESGIRKTIQVISGKVIREVLVNAIIHQDFAQIGTRVFVEIFKDRVEISNPGIPLIKPLRFVDERPSSRNERLVKEMHQYGFSEDRGSGWDKIIWQSEIDKKPTPEIRVSDQSTTVVLWYDKPLERLSPDERDWMVYFHTVIKYIASKELASNTSLRERLKLPTSKTSTVSGLYRQALKNGLIKRFDPAASNKFMKYVPAWANNGISSNP